jgi:hypothetical protein
MAIAFHCFLYSPVTTVAADRANTIETADRLLDDDRTALPNEVGEQLVNGSKDPSQRHPRAVGSGV